MSALSLQFDIDIRMFVKPNDYWPRECLVLARIGFTKERVGYGRALVQRLVELAAKFSYRYLAIESANANASAFAERLGFSPRDNGRHWIGTVDASQEALSR
ncbi:GNAT family N-acetyltransferase [uncultured Pseudomonas sp.]|uniref:GNAT family N-acetyltransferase n=1 Tax=uncultured Pseudomonas sp. TaxID=114707 RepID=UPI0025885F70|nr:GNAT family N-acetyltransferase [uncultured Pseudomonas sp.]